MENPVCSFEIVHSPSQRYANTVNLVFFRAIPTTKNFQKYVDGLKHWKSYIKLFPHSQLQIFVDKYIADQPEIRKLMESLDARVYLFECPEYMRRDGFHMGLFATMVRFYPMFDINTKPMSIAHIQELEPSLDTLPKMELLEKVSRMKLPVELSVVYTSNKMFKTLNKSSTDLQMKFEESIPYGWMIAGRFVALEKIPFSLWTKYLADIKAGKKFFNIYAHNQIAEHGNYSFGVDEIFLNSFYLPWLVENGRAIGIIIDYKPTLPVYFNLDKITKDKRSQEIFNYILDSDQTVDESFLDLDKLFYRNYNSERAKKITQRFNEIVEKYPDWLGIGFSKFILMVFKGYTNRTCLVIVQSGKIVGVKDIK